MKGIDKITERISADAQNEAAMLIENAKAEAKSIVEEYLREAEREAEEIIELSVTSAQERKQRRAGVAGLESGKMRLALKQEMIDRAFELALEKLRSLPEARLLPFLVRLAVSASRTGSEQIIMNMSDRERYGKKLVKQANQQLLSEGNTGALTLSSDIRHIKGGLILADGNIEVNCTFQSIARLIRDDIAADIANIMFDSESLR